MSISSINVPSLISEAPLVSTITLILMLVAAALFTLGWRLAVHRRYGIHRWVQTCAVILNAAIVLIVMVRSYATYILPGIPAKLTEGIYALTTLHALIGAAASILGIYVILVGNKILPKRLRFTNFKRFMRVAYALYMTATLLGVVVYFVLYG